MDSVIKWGLILGGGYLALRYFGIDPLASLGNSTVSSAPTSSNAGAGTTSTTADTTTAANTLNAVQALMAKSGQDPNSYYTVDVFNYYYNAIRGVPGPDQATLFPGDTPNKQYAISEWWNAMQGKGFSGLGIIANRMNPYWNPKGQPFGSNISAKASERWNVRFN